MKKVQKRLQELTTMILNHEDPTSDECAAYIAELKLLRELIATWKAFNGYEGDLDPSADPGDRPERKSTQMWE